MKYNKKEQDAVDLLFKIASSLKDGKSLIISSGEHEAILRELGISFKSSTYRKKEIEQFVKGKEDILLSVTSCRSSWNYPNTYCIFPFQVKSKKMINKKD